MILQNKECVYVEDEPGDGTHYEFAILDEDENYLLIMMGRIGAKFASYGYRKDSLRDLKSRYPVLLKNIGIKSYQNEIIDSGFLSEKFLGYMGDHSDCNVWTAVAAVRAALMVLEDV